MAPLFLRSCLVTTRDLAVVPRHVRGTCTHLDMLTENEAPELLQKASRATSSVPRDEGLKMMVYLESMPRLLRYANLYLLTEDSSV